MVNGYILGSLFIYTKLTECLLIAYTTLVVFIFRFVKNVRSTCRKIC
jgi:hypothetical protein